MDGPLENILQHFLQISRVLWKQYLSIWWTELLLTWWRIKGTYYINRKDEGLIAIFITISKCIELFCYTQCLVTCSNYYFVSGMYNITNWLFHGIRFSTFIKNIYFKLQKKKRKEKSHPLKKSFFLCCIFYSNINASLIYNICKLPVTLFLSVKETGFTIIIFSLKTQNYVSLSAKLSWTYFSMIYYIKSFVKFFSVG